MAKHIKCEKCGFNNLPKIGRNECQYCGHEFNFTEEDKMAFLKKNQREEKPRIQTIATLGPRVEDTKRYKIRVNSKGEALDEVPPEIASAFKRAPESLPQNNEQRPVPDFPKYPQEQIEQVPEYSPQPQLQPMQQYQQLRPMPRIQQIQQPQQEEYYSEEQMAKIVLDMAFITNNPNYYLELFTVHLNNKLREINKQ